MEAVARLNNYPTSPRKMRLLADLIRGMEVDKALEVLQHSTKHPSTPLYKLLKSAINNWEQRNGEERVEDAGLVVKTIMVDGGRVIKRMRPAPQGRGYRVRKRSNHVTIVVDSALGNGLALNGLADEDVAVAEDAAPVEIKDEKTVKDEVVATAEEKSTENTTKNKAE